MKPLVRILGAGFSGLTLAHELQKKGFPVEIYEEKPYAGGLIRSIKTPLCLRETAANGIVCNQEVEELFSELGVEILPTKKESKRRYIWVEGKARRWPIGFKGSIRLLCVLLKFLLLGKKIFTPAPQESLGGWAERIFNQEIARKMIFPALQGIYAGDPQKMSANLIVGSFMQERAPKGRIQGTVSCRGGMGELIQALEKQVLAAGGKIFFHSKAFPKKDELWVSAVSAAQSGFSVEMLPLSTVTLVFNETANPVKGFGCLFAREEGFRALGVLLNRHIFDNRGPSHSETWIFGGATDKAICSLSKEELRALALKERERFLGFSEEPSEAYVVQWEQALPHYTLEWQKHLEEIAQGPLHFYTGNYMGGLGLAKILSFNKKLAIQIDKRYG